MFCLSQKNTKAARSYSKGSMRGSRGGQGSGPSLKIHKNIGFLRTTGLDPLKITKLSSQSAFNVGSLSALKRNAQWNFACGPMMTRF